MEISGHVLTELDVDTMENLGHYGWDEFVSRAANGSAVAGSSHYSRNDNDDWAGASFQNAIEYAQHGWHDGVTLVQANLDRLPPSADVIPDWNLNVGGSICNVPAFIAGEPECMWQMSDEKRSERRISLVVNSFISAVIGKEAGIAYASAVAALIRGLEASGINTAVYVINPTKDASGSTRDNVAAYAVTVREFGEPLDIARMAFAFHPASYRRVHFAWQETKSEVIKYGLGNGGYGRPVQINSALVHKMLGDVGYVAILPSINMLYAKSPEAMLATMKKATEAAVAAY